MVGPSEYEHVSKGDLNEELALAVSLREQCCLRDPVSSSQHLSRGAIRRSGHPIGADRLRDERKVPRMENPPKGGERNNRKIVKKVSIWLMLQALGAWLRRLIDTYL